MNTTEKMLVAFVVQQLDLGKPEYVIVDELIQKQGMARPIAQLLVARVARELQSRSGSRRWLGRIGLVLLAASIIPWFLGMRRRSAPPLWPDLFPEGSNLPYFLLIPAFIGAFFFFYGLPYRRWRPSTRSPQKLPPGQVPPGWPGPGAPELPSQGLPPGQVRPGWPNRQTRDP